jgi:hypothetical protein
MPVVRDMEKDTKFPIADAFELTGTSLTAGEAGIVLVLGGLILGAIGAGLMVLFKSLQHNKKAAR